MPSVQDTYVENIRPGVEGQRADMRPVVLFSRTVEDVAGIGFGKVVQQGANDHGVTTDLNTTAMTAQSFLGITMREQGVTPEFPNGWAKGEEALIMRKGAIWVTVAVAVTPRDVVTVTLATGVIGKTAVGAGVVAIPNARWETSTTGAGLAKLYIG